MLHIQPTIQTMHVQLINHNYLFILCFIYLYSLLQIYLQTKLSIFNYYCVQVRIKDPQNILHNAVYIINYYIQKIYMYILIYLFIFKPLQYEKWSKFVPFINQQKSFMRKFLQGPDNADQGGSHYIYIFFNNLFISFYNFSKQKHLINQLNSNQSAQSQYQKIRQNSFQNSFKFKNMDFFSKKAKILYLSTLKISPPLQN
eukprot:TRINITY_DN461_c2_g1_i1.p3 TRINITY_DN461_c2_g1~~TRINITY_DN461_c2_g1_i1.p3  ORF type:complete len:200 (-),score=-18.60 TRINITY_DN461_c2_g1_i1:258-857(-)